MKASLCLTLAGTAAAFPAMLEGALGERSGPTVVGQNGCKISAECDAPHHISNKQIGYDPNAITAAQKLSQARTNCGQQGPCLTFSDSDQLVSVSGQHAYADPSPDDIRGPCPGLNAAANHGYLPRNGVASITQTIVGLGALYNMSPELAGFLAAYAVVFDGDFLTQTWSIGGPPQSLIGSNPILGEAEGISWSHNKYEGDSSIGRCDAYQNGGDAHSLSITRFKYAYESGMKDDRYTIDKFARAFTKNAARSEATNPMYFAPLFSTTLVSPAAYNFVINFMSNHTSEEKSGYLDGNMFKQFFGIKGEYPNFTWAKGKERVPENWYRRPTSNQYNAVGGVFGDLIPTFAAYPDSFRFGGNTNGVNSYTGIDIANFTNGAFTAKNLFKGNNLACFLYASIQQGAPDELSGKATALLFKHLDNAFGALACPQITKFNDNAFTQYPGRNYSPKAGKGAPVTC